MVGKWERYSIADLIARGLLFVGDGYRAKNKELGVLGLPFARAGNINGGFRFTDVDRYPVERLHRVGNKISEPGDVVFTSKGTVGRFAFVRNDTPPFVYSPQLCFWRVLDPRLIIPRFLYYWMHGREFFVQFTGVSGQTDMAEYVSLTDQRRMYITLPNLVEQTAIANILGTLDDKIDSNRRTSETLEATARALFKSWFVDYDPTRAQAEGRDPAVPQQIAELFPSSFEDSELGAIPRGWRVMSVKGLCTRVAIGPFGSDIKTAYFTSEGVPVIRGGNLKEGFVDEGFVFVSEEKADQLRNANAFPGDIVITHRGTLGQVGLIPMRSRYSRYVVSQSQLVITPDLRLVTPGFLLEYFRSPAGQHELLANTSQTGVPAIATPTTSVKAVRLIVPPIHLLQKFEMFLGPIANRVVQTTAESRTLIALRDTLLQKLISGELPIRNAERFISVSG